MFIFVLLIVMALLLVDNHDSFTYNLVQLIEEASCKDYIVELSEKVNIKMAQAFSHIMFSPGPGLPNDFPIMKRLLQAYASQKHFLGICLGHQAIAEYYGGQLLNLPKVVHGQSVNVYLQKEDLLFKDVRSPFEVGLYHSWVVDTQNFPSDLEITALSDIGRIMALRHKAYSVRGVQFHPESIMTPQGLLMIKNWLTDTVMYD